MLSCERGEALAQVTYRNCDAPSLEVLKAKAGWDPEYFGPVKAAPAHSTGVGTRESSRFLPTRNILWFRGGKGLLLCPALLSTSSKPDKHFIAVLRPHILEHPWGCWRVSLSWAWSQFRRVAVNCFFPVNQCLIHQYSCCWVFFLGKNIIAVTLWRCWVENSISPLLGFSK